MGKGLWMIAVAALILSGCLGREIDPQRSVVTAPPGTALPLAARTMLYISPRDLDRPLIIEATLHRNEETTTKDGRILEASAKKVLSQTFAQVETNNPAIQPQLVVKVLATPKFSRRDNILKVGCSMDVLQADGAVLGSFVARFDSKDPVDYKDWLGPAYSICLKQAADQMLASPAFAKIAKAGLPAPHPAAYKSYMESLGLKP